MQQASYTWLFTSMSDKAESLSLGAIIRKEPLVDYCVWSHGYDQRTKLHTLKGFVLFKSPVTYSRVQKTDLFIHVMGCDFSWKIATVDEADYYDGLEQVMSRNVYPTTNLDGPEPTWLDSSTRFCASGPEVVDLTGPDSEDESVLDDDTRWGYDSSCDGGIVAPRPLRRCDAVGDLAALEAAEACDPPSLSLYYDSGL